MLPSGVYNETYSQDIAVIRTRTHMVLATASFLAAFALPHLAGDALTSWLTMVMITIIAVLGLVVTTGYCGQISIGHAAFMAVGAFTYAHLTRHGVPWIAAIIGGGITASIVGTLFGLSCLKVKDLYLALTTLAAQFIVPWMIIEYFGGARGVVPAEATIGGMVLLDQNHFYYLALIVLLATTYFVFNLGRSKAGRAFKAIRYQDSAAESMGIDIRRYKLLSFTIGCFIAGIAGSLMVIFMGKADIEYFTVKDSIWLLAMLLLGGSGSFVGAYFGVFFILGISEGSHRIVSFVAASFPDYQVALSSLPHFLMALIIIVLVLYEPRGWYHRWLTFKASYRVWPWAHW